MSTPEPRATTRRPRAELLGWSAGWVAAICALALAAPLGTAPLLSGLVIAAGSLALLWGPSARLPLGLGWANRVTLVRAVLVSCVAMLAAYVIADSARVSVLLLATGALAVVLDGVDGAVARRTGSTSDLGARFDMELDALLIAVLSVLAAREYGGWVLAIGAARYVFAAAGLGWPWLRRPLPYSLARRVIAAAQPITLLVALSGLAPAPVGTGALLLALAALAWSFGRDLRWLRRNR